jgi:hypothetical protein
MELPELAGNSDAIGSVSDFACAVPGALAPLDRRIDPYAGWRSSGVTIRA